MKSDKTFFERLDTRIALAFLLLSLLSISLFAFVMYRLSGSLFAREDMRRTRASLEQSSEYISSYLEKLKSFSSLIAMHPDIRSALAKSDKKSLESISALTALAENSDPRIRAVAVISKEGFLITSGSSMAMPLSGDMMQEKWYQDALSSAQMPTLASTGHGVFTMDREDWIISVCQEIRGEGGDVKFRYFELVQMVDVTLRQGRTARQKRRAFLVEDALRRHHAGFELIRFQAYHAENTPFCAGRF